MIRRMTRRLFRLALVIGGAAALYKVVQARRPYPVPPEDAWKPAAPPPAKPAAATTPEKPAAPAKPAAPTAPEKSSTAWVEPDGEACPATHPVKAKLGSKIFHLPGMTAYDRTTPDRCYPDEAAAEADGFRKAKR